MAFNLKTVDELVQLAHAGAGFTLAAGLRPTHDLIAIAHAASHGKARITFTGLALRPLDDLINIAHAGKGAVTFEDSPTR